MMDITEDEFKLWYRHVNNLDHSFIMGVKDKGYISLQNENEGKLQEYHFRSQEESDDDLEYRVADDKMISMFMKKAQLDELRDDEVVAFKKYLRRLGNEYGVTIDDIVDIINDCYNVNLKLSK